MPKVTKKEIDEALLEVMGQIRYNKKIVEEVIDKMEGFEYLAGDIQGYISNTENELKKLDTRTICLLFDCIYEVTEINQSYPKHYFAENEIMTSKQFTGDLLRKDRVELPMTLHGVKKISHNTYLYPANIKEISNWMNSLILNWNKDTQREPTVEKFNGQIIFEPTIYPENVKEITELLKLGKLRTADSIVINAGVKTSTSELGEFIYNEENETLFITNCKLDIIDGYHRCRAIQNAMSIDNSLNTNFIVVFTNYTVKECQDLLEQKSKATPMSSKRIDEHKNSFTNDIIQKLKTQSELQGRVIDAGIRVYDNKYLVAHDILAEGINANFKIEKASQVIDISDFLCDFFDYLVGSFEYEFIKNVTETREKSYINHDFMIGFGFITLAKRMMDEGIRIRKIKHILNTIDFNKQNELWKNLKLVDKNGELVDYDKAKKIITKFFKELELKEGVLSE